VVSFLLAFPPISYMHSQSPPFVLHALPISSSLTWFNMANEINSLHRNTNIQWQLVLLRHYMLYTYEVFTFVINITECRKDLC
jgi:hypothetical protein